LAYISLNNAFDNPKTADKASSVLAIVGLVNIPIIYYSVEWMRNCVIVRLCVAFVLTNKIATVAKVSKYETQI
jgi:hypothetical protein